MKVNGKILGVIILVIIVLGILVLSYQGEPSRVNVSLAQDYSMGDINAPVTILEFSDFQCPYCGVFYEQTLPSLREKYINTGKVRFVYRNFPLISIHENSLLAAQAAEAAGEQGKYWEMHDLLYSNQTALAPKDLTKYASSLGLDMNKFTSALESGKFIEKINKDIADGTSYGINGTPAFFINGIKIVGSQPFANFEKIIDSELAKKK